MPNYEFYAQIYMQSREQQYTASYNAAYRDLMAEYKEEVRVQNLMAEMLVRDQQALARTRSGSGRGREHGVKWGDLEKYRTKTVADEKIKAEAELKALYDVPDFRADNMIHDVIYQTGTGPELQERWGQRGVRRELENLDRRQRDRLMLDWEDALMARHPLKSRDEIRREYFGYKELTVSTPGRPAVPFDKQRHNRSKTMEIRKTNEKIEEEYGKPTTAETEMKKNYYRSQQAAKAEAGAVKQEPLKSIAPEDYEFKEIKPPTEQDILARAAGYYAPSAGKEFQGSMEEIAAEREAAAQARKAEKAQLAEDVAALPEWAGRVYKVQGDTEAIIDVDDAELTSAPQEWARLHMDTEKYDLPGSIAAIEKEFPDDALAQSQALAMVMRALVKRRRTKAAGEVDLVELVEE